MLIKPIPVKESGSSTRKSATSYSTHMFVQNFPVMGYSTHYLSVPRDAWHHLGLSRGDKVEVTLNGHSFETNIPYNVEQPRAFPVSQDDWKKAKLRYGGEADLTIRIDKPKVEGKRLGIGANLNFR